MASNEHAYLSEANLHNPKGLSLALNNTICSKNSSGALEWASKSFIKTDNVVSTGYCTLTANYQHAESQLYGQSPYDINQDYGSSTISSATTVNQKGFFKIANFGLSQDGIINRCIIQVTNSASSSPFTVSLVKYTPSNINAQAYPVVLFEKEVNGNSSQDLVFTTELVITDYVNTSISKGDHIFIMAKGYGEGKGGSIGDLVQISVITEIGYLNN